MGHEASGCESGRVLFCALAYAFAEQIFAPAQSDSRRTMCDGGQSGQTLLLERTKR